jgi:hypothetical protein
LVRRSSSRCGGRHLCQCLCRFGCPRSPRPLLLALLVLLMLLLLLLLSRDAPLVPLLTSARRRLHRIRSCGDSSSGCGCTRLQADTK